MGEMRFRRLGSSGLAVSVVGIGCNNFGRRIGADRVAEVVGAALDLGINLFDTADVYGDPAGTSEELLGAALGSRRDEAVVATKFGSYMRGALDPDWGARGARRYIHRAVEASLRRLRTDRIDLYQMHEPDPRTPIEETLSTLDDLVRDGKVRYVGSSNFAGWQVADAAWTAQVRNLTAFISAQNEYSLIHRDAERELLPACERFDVGVLPYFPLASGLLTGKFHRGEAPAAGTRLAEPRNVRWLAEAPWDLIEELTRYADKRGRSLLEVAFAGLLTRPVVASVIAGARSADQVRANAATADWQPSPDDVAGLDEILQR
jgi:aryl-alcohol dehydrogenase-like predicted oxidoreductase